MAVIWHYPPKMVTVLYQNLNMKNWDHQSLYQVCYSFYLFIYFITVCPFFILFVFFFPYNCLVPFLKLFQSALEEKKVVSDENKNPIQKPEDMVIDAITNDGVVAVDSTKSEAGKNEGKQASPSSTSTPISNKPAKRRITPMAIDP